MSTSTFDATKHPRQGAGAVTGNAGHFATKVLDDAGVDADLDMDLGFLDTEQAPGFGMVPATPAQEADPLVGSLRATELHAFRMEKARLLARSYDNVDADELISEAVISYMSAISDKSPTTGEDKPVSPVAHDPAKARGFIVNAMKNIARREAFGTDPHDMKGKRALSERIAAETQATGQAPTSARVDELAEEVRLSFPARRRPRIGFHKSVRVSSLDAADDSGLNPVLSAAERAIEEDRIAATSSGEDFAEGSLGDKLTRSLIEEGATKTATARSAAARQVWDVVREKHSAPPIAEHTLSESQAAALRSRLADAGGVRAALRAWNQADDDHEAVQAVFAPFGHNLTDDDRCAVMDALSERPAYAPSLVDTAISVATTPRKA